MTFIWAVLPIFTLLLACEFWWRKRNSEEEFSRKVVHIGVGSYVAFWPFFLSWTQIQILSLAFIVAVAASQFFGVFKAIHSVQRPTWGEMFFALAVGALTLVTHDAAIYAAAVLQMSLADGFAAVIGNKYGGRHRYLVFSHTKSLAGTLTFLVISIAVLAVLNSRFPNPLDPLQILGISALAAAIENIGVRGFDNLLVPLLVGVLLTQV